jgi:geranylgeranyl pyrophosphate synthase
MMERLEGRLLEAADGHGDLLARHAGDTIAAGGKRLRPLLLFLAAGAPPPESETLLRSAVAVELVHSATLVHDDVLDGSPLRRGRPTVMASGGRLAATATGDLLFSRAFAELAHTGSVAAVQVLSRASGELATGELMQRADAWRAVATERYLERCRLKTGVLFRAACELGGLEGDDEERLPGLALFGERIGIAFQLLDDVLDVSGPPERTGKPRERDPELGALDLHSVCTPEQAAEVCARITETGSLEDTRGRALELVASAKAELPDMPARQRGALELIADGVVERYS